MISKDIAFFIYYLFTEKRYCPLTYTASPRLLLMDNCSLSIVSLHCIPLYIGKIRLKKDGSIYPRVHKAIDKHVFKFSIRTFLYPLVVLI